MSWTGGRAKVGLTCWLRAWEWRFGRSSAQHSGSRALVGVKTLLPRAARVCAAAVRAKNLSGFGTATLCRNAVTHPAALSERCRNEDSRDGFGRRHPGFSDLRPRKVGSTRQPSLRWSSGRTRQSGGEVSTAARPDSTSLAWKSATVRSIDTCGNLAAVRAARTAAGTRHRVTARSARYRCRGPSIGTSRVCRP